MVIDLQLQLVMTICRAQDLAVEVLIILNAAHCSGKHGSFQSWVLVIAILIRDIDPHPAGAAGAQYNPPEVVWIAGY
jgi:hypothetical protein